MEGPPNISHGPPGPEGERVIELDRRYMATSTKCCPVVAESAHGSVVVDVDGNEFLDFSSGISVMNVGHCHPRVVSALTEQAKRLWHFAGTDYYYEAQARLAERLAGRVPGDVERKVFLSNSGTECVEAALKLVRWSTGRKRTLAFIGAFHGRTMGSLSLTASKTVQRDRFFPMLDGVTHIPYAYCYRCPYKMTYPDCDCWCAKILEEVYLDTLLPPEELGAVFIEPVQGEGGYIVPPSEFVRIIADTVRRHGGIVVDDEVQAGMGRTGRMWAIEHHDVVPDVLCSAKALGSGMPIGATVFDATLDFGVQGAHSNTYGGNLLACAASLATMGVIEDEHLVEAAEDKGRHMRERLDAMMDANPIMGDVRGLGMMVACEFVKDPVTKEYAVLERDSVIDACFRKGLVLLPCGRSGIRLIPALNIPDDQLDTGLDIFEAAVRDVD